MVNASAFSSIPFKAPFPHVLALSADGRWAISGSNDHVLKVWDLEASELLLDVDTPGSLASALAISPDGLRALVLASGNNSHELWDLQRREMQSLPQDRGPIQSLWLSLDWRHAVSASQDGTIMVWDWENVRKLHSISAYKGLVTCAVIALDGWLVVSCSDDHALKVWDMETGQCLATFMGKSPIRCCALASDCRTIVAGERSGRIHFLRLVLPDDKVDTQKLLFGNAAGPEI
jgi:WD40 repeat protein